MPPPPGVVPCSPGFKCPTPGIKRYQLYIAWVRGNLGAAGIDWWILFNILKEDGVNQPKDEIRRSASGRKQKSTSKMQREKKQEKKKKREAEKREAVR